MRAVGQTAEAAKLEIRAMVAEALWEVDEILGLNEKAWRRELGLAHAHKRLLVDFHRAVIQAFIAEDTNSADLARRIGGDVREFRKLLLTPERWKLDDVSDILISMGFELGIGVEEESLLRPLSNREVSA